MEFENKSAETLIPQRYGSIMENRNGFKYFGVITVLVVIGLLVIGCPIPTDSSNSGTGKKEGTTHTFTFRNSSSYEVTVWIEGAVSGSVTTEEAEKKLAKGESYAHKHALSTINFDYYPANQVTYTDSGTGTLTFKDK